MAVNLLDFDLEGLTAFCLEHGEKAFRAKQIFQWVHQRGVTDAAQMSDLAQSTRKWLSLTACVQALPILSVQESSDGTIKWLFDVGGGDAVETVYIPEDDRATLCVSSQAGCAVGCSFCSTGHQGFSRNLTSAEIISQIWYVEHTLRKKYQTSERVISNVVMMGMGEPLQNYKQLVPALKTMLSDYAYGLSRRRVTVSTSGVVPMMERLAVDCPVALAVSLHAPNDALRNELVPLNKKYPIAELLSACSSYLKSAPRDFITLEYCMLDGVNDSLAHARDLISILKMPSAPKVKVNLIPFNPFSASGYRKSSRDAVMSFAKSLQNAGIIATVRKTRGDDIDAACGQLAGEVVDRTHVEKRMRFVPTQSL